MYTFAAVLEQVLILVTMAARSASLAQLARARDL